jgi:hypothetical protein
MARIARIIGEIRAIRGPFLDELSRHDRAPNNCRLRDDAGLRAKRKVLDFRRFLGIGDLFLPALQADFEVFWGFCGGGMANSAGKRGFLGRIFADLVLGIWRKAEGGRGKAERRKICWGWFFGAGFRFVHDIRRG